MSQAHSPAPHRTHHHHHGVVIAHAGEVTGEWHGVKPDIVDYLREVAIFFGREIHVNSGKRSAEDQAQAMFKYWTKNLCRGLIYVGLRHERAGKHDAQKKSESRYDYLARCFKHNEKGLKMDNYYKTAMETPAETDENKKSAKTKFFEEARGIKSKHISGDAVDLIGPQISEPMRKVLEMHLKHVKEGGDRCYHLERIRERQIPKVDDILRVQWQLIRDPSGTTHPIYHYQTAPFCKPDDVANYC